MEKDMNIEDLIHKYLWANRLDIPGLQLFNKEVKPDELRKRVAEGLARRRQLVQIGPTVILPALRAAPEEMRQAAALATAPIAQLNPKGYAEIADGMAETIFRNVADLVSEMGNLANKPLIE